MASVRGSSGGFLGENTGETALRELGYCHSVLRNKSSEEVDRPESVLTACETLKATKSLHEVSPLIDAYN
jgi:hypothetical protein